MELSLSKFMLLGILAVIALFAASDVAEASYYSQYYGGQGAQNNYFGGNSNYNSNYLGGGGRSSARGSYLQFPYYPGSYSENQNRNSFDLSEIFNQENSRSVNNQFNENLLSQNTAAAFNFNRNALNVNEFAQANQRGSNSGSLSYSLGNGNKPTYKRVLSVNGRGKRNDMTITETIFGGEKINYRQNFANGFSTSAGANKQASSNNLNSGASFTNNQVNRNTANSLQEKNSLSNKYTVTESNFGRGFNVNFNT